MMKLFLILILVVTTINSVKSARNQKQQQSINDGHRLITRALWRIFDAISEKQNHNPLYDRIKLVEGSLNDMVTSDSKIENKLAHITTSLKDQKTQMEKINKELERIKNLETRIRKIEEWHLRLQSDETDTSVLGEIAQPVFSSCPEPFEAVGGECLFVSSSKKLSWRDARKDCVSIGGDLASPINLKALRIHLLKQPSAIRPEYLWIGGSKSFENSWVWVTGKQSGRPIDMSRETWNEKLPEGAGDCMGIFEGSGYKAYDFVCAEKDYFVCQHFL